MKAIKRTMLRMAALTLAGCAVMGMSGCGSSSSSGANSVNSATGPTIDASTGKRVAVSENAIAIFEEATKQAKTDPKTAIETFKKAAKAQSNFAEAYYNIGLLEQKLGNKNDARDAYETALKMRPNLSAAQTNLAKMLIDEGKPDEAEAALLKIVDEKTGTDPYNVEANLNLGMIYRKRGEDILEKERGGSEPKFSMTGSENRGEIKNKDAYNMFAKSISYVRRALASDSNNIYCYENLAAVYYAMNSLEVARLVIDQAYIKYGEYNNILQEDKAAGRITDQEYDQKVYTPKDLSAIYNTSGLIYLAEGEVSMGNAEFKKAVEADPTNISAMLNVAGIAVNVQDYQLAYDLYNKVLSLEPNNTEAYLSKGVAARGLNRLDEAETIYKDIMKNHPEYPQAWFNEIVLIQEYYQKVDEAREMWVKFSSDDTANKVIPGRVAEAKERIKQIDEQKEAERKNAEEARKMEEKMEQIRKMQEEYEKQQAAEEAAAGGN